MAYYKPVAALWQRLPKHRKLSIRTWLSEESILILGTNARVKKALDVINELIFRVVVEKSTCSRIPAADARGFGLTRRGLPGRF